jgi:Bacterial Ig-like domain (group 2).
LNGETAVTVQRGSEEISIIKCADGDLAIENSELIAKEGATVKIGRLPVSLKCVYRATGAGAPTGVTYESSDESVAKVDANGNVEAISDGNVVITARAGGKFVNISLKIVTPVTYIVLSDSGVDEKRGIAKECIYGNMYFNDAGEIVYMRQIKVAKPAGTIPTDYIWQTDCPEIAAIDENGIITYAPDFEGEKTVTVTVYSKNTAYASDTVSTVYIFNVRKGMNVGTREEMRKATEAKNVDIFLRNNITYTEADGGGWFINLWTNLYGNGYIIDYNNADNNEGGNIVSVRASNVTVRNLTIRSAQPPSDDLISNESYKNGSCMEVHPINNGIMRNDSYENVNVQYCILEYGKWCMALYGGDITVEGCVLRNTSIYNIYISTSDRDFTDRDAEGNPVGEQYTYTSNTNLTLKNTIMAKSIGPLLGSASWTFEPQGNSYVHIEGFLEMYNWQNIVNMDVLPLEDSVSPEIATLIRKIISTELGQDKYDHFAQKQKGTKYFNLGLLMMGVIGVSNTKVDGALTENDIEKINYTVLNLPPVSIYTNTENCPRSPTDSYTLDEKTCARLRGEQL